MFAFYVCLFKMDDQSLFAGLIGVFVLLSFYRLLQSSAFTKHTGYLKNLAAKLLFCAE